jgi:integrase
MRTASVWIYRPESHKTEHHGHDRVICLGRQAQEILRPWLDRAPDAYCFQSSAKEPPPRFRETVPPRQLHACHPTGVQAGDRSREKNSENIGEIEGRVVPTWSRNQLQHAHATRVREQFGLEAAQVVLGHASADVTQIYAKRNLSKAREVALQNG